MTPSLIDGFARLEQRLSSERGPFVLFAILLRPELSTLVSTNASGVLGRWDVVVSADWLEGARSDVEYITDQLKTQMGVQTLSQLASVVVLAPFDAWVQAVTSAFNTEHEPVELRNTNLFGIEIDTAFIITAKKLPTPKAVASQ